MTPVVESKGGSEKQSPQEVHRNMGSGAVKPLDVSGFLPGTAVSSQQCKARRGPLQALIQIVCPLRRDQAAAKLGGSSPSQGLMLVSFGGCYLFPLLRRIKGVIFENKTKQKPGKTPTSMKEIPRLQTSE